jgi:hypothetical protein
MLAWVGLQRSELLTHDRALRASLVLGQGAELALHLRVDPKADH